MDLRIFTEPQEGATYDDLLAVALRAESLGFGAFFRSDHYRGITNPGRLPGPTDAWITLAGLARDTSTIRLGTLVTSATFRHPGPLAITVAGVDQMSGGRVELGIGAGWYDDEHHAHGIPYPGLGERFERLEEQLEIVTGMWETPAGETFSHDGAHYSLVDSPALPKPAQPHLPIIIGGHGPKRTPRLAATFADEFNVAFSSLADTVALNRTVTDACEQRGRDAGTLARSAAQTVCVGATDDEFARRAEAIGRQPDEIRRLSAAAGTTDEVIEKLSAFRSGGITRIYLQMLDLADLDHLDLVAASVAPAVS